MNKFELNDLVSFNTWSGLKKGVIRSRHTYLTRNSNVGTNYDVFYKEEKWAMESSVAQFMGKWGTTARFEEKELTLIEKDEVVLNDIMGHLFVNTASAQDLDKLAEDFRLERIENPVISDVKVVPITCEHVWKNYQGLDQNFDYCEKCDIKRS
jgi:hypothetical protein